MYAFSLSVCLHAESKFQALFSIFVQWLSYRMEKVRSSWWCQHASANGILSQARRHLHQLNAQLKQAYFQLESSKQAEAQLSESRSLFAAYIFHEVRVPLNTASAYLVFPFLAALYWAGARC